ncbi:MAG: hypothetical protein FWD19_01515 [Defluviitaleaceae bacterium]|nr:hypothetical protein [Defluviitaleaceae bacterium]
MKKLFLIVVLVFALAACGGNGNDTTPVSDERETPAPTETSEIPAEENFAEENFAEENSEEENFEEEILEEIAEEIAEENPWATEIDSPGGQAAKMTYGETWDSFQIAHKFTDDNYTVKFAVLHPAQAGDDNFTIQPLEPIRPGQWNFQDEETSQDIGTFNIFPDVWNEIELSFAGAQARDGIRFAGDYPRTVGDGFFIANIVVTNSANTEVINLKFAGGLENSSPHPDGNGSAEVVAAP